jgi:murein DD-endopeptidase MepM/ murein hydrolase activator NlpD
MKFSVFVLGFLTGILAAYLILTRFWWPDIRLDAAHAALPAIVSADPSPEPSEFATPETPTPEVPSELIAVSPPLPSPTEPITSPPPFETVISPPPPTEVKTLDLPLLQTDLDRLRMRGLFIPVQGIEKKSLRDTFTDDRSGQRHQAIDIMAARGTPVLAAGDGRVEKLFTSKPGGLTIYEFDPQGEYCYYYAHLDGYATGVVQGKVLRKGDVIGYVGSTGNASATAPHLHFTIFRLGAAKKWWEGTAINAYPLWGLPPGS